MQDEWATTFVGAGAVAVIDAQTGGIVRLSTGALTNNDDRLHWGDIRSLLVSKKVSIEVRAKLNQITNVMLQLEMRFDGTTLVLFRYRTDLGHTSWHIYTANGAATDQDSGIAIDTNYHIFRIECFPTDEVHFYIDGDECANSPITTNIPDDAADYLQPFFYIQTLEDLSKSVDIDYVYIRQER